MRRPEHPERRAPAAGREHPADLGEHHGRPGRGRPRTAGPSWSRSGSRTASAARGNFTFYWLVDTPAIIFATESLGDGQAGETYSDQFFVAEGVPPFVYELVEEGLPEDYTSDKSTQPRPRTRTPTCIYNPGAPPTVNPAGGAGEDRRERLPRSDRPGAGLRRRRTRACRPRASCSSRPRARSHGHPAPSRHLLRELPRAEQPGAELLRPARVGDVRLRDHRVAADRARTRPTRWTAPSRPTPPYAEIAEAEQGVVYNPDGGPAGLQLLATGGVPAGRAHGRPARRARRPSPRGETQRRVRLGDRLGPGRRGEPAHPGMELLTRAAIFRVVDGQEDNLVPQFDQALGFTAIGLRAADAAGHDGHREGHASRSVRTGSS